MSKIQKWHAARETHGQLVALLRTGEGSPLSTNNYYGVAMQSIAVDWMMARRADLHGDLIAFSRERVAAAAREALSECEQIRADAAMDVESIEEGT